MDGDYVLVIGSAVLEVSARTTEVLQPGSRQGGYIHRSVSGVARNIAENLARLDIETVLLCAVADDDIGQHVITQSRLAGIDCRHILRVGDARTATAVLLYRSEENCTRVDDLEIADYSATGEPLDKAGAYGIQGAASKFVQRIEGCYFNVVGLPISRVYSCIRSGLRCLGRSAGTGDGQSAQPLRY